MDRRQFLVSAMGVSLAALALEGCGGGGGAAGGGGALQTTRGSLKLPAGSALTAAQLSVGNSIASQPANADGTFTATTQTGAPVVVTVSHTSGRGVMFGFVDPASASNVLDAQAQAVALLYFALGGYAVPVANKRDLLSALQSHAVTAPLTAVVATRIAADPFALENGDAQIAAALQTAFNSIVQGFGRSASISSHTASPASGARSATVKSAGAVNGSSRAAVVLPEITIDQVGEIGGIEVVQDTSNTNIVGVLATNHKRRRCQVLLYRTGEQNAAGVLTTYPLAIPVGSPVPLGPTGNLSLNAAITSLFGGQTPFAPVSTNTIPLTMQPAATKTFFEVVVLGSADGSNPDPTFFGEAKYTNEVAGWQTTRGALNLQSTLQDLFFVEAMEMLGFGAAPLLDAQVNATIAAIQAIPDLPVRQLLQQAAKGGIGLSTIALLQETAGTDIVANNMRRSLSNLLVNAQAQQALLASQGLGAKQLALFLKMLISVLNLVQIGLGAGDIAAILTDLALGHNADRWSITLFQPDVTISPKTVTIVAGAHKSFTANIPTGVQGTIAYDWSTTATFAVLSDGGANTGRSFESSSATVDLATTPSDTGPISVSVAAFQLSVGGVKRKIGEATATVTLGATGPTQVTAGTVYMENFPAPGSDGVAFIAAVFFTFNNVPEATKFSVFDDIPTDFGTITEAAIMRGAPLLDSSNFGIPIPNPSYGASNRFYNLGKGLIGCLAYGESGVDVSQAPLIRQQVKASAMGRVGTVYIS